MKIEKLSTGEFFLLMTQEELTYMAAWIGPTAGMDRARAVMHGAANYPTGQALAQKVLNKETSDPFSELYDAFADMNRKRRKREDTNK